MIRPKPPGRGDVTFEELIGALLIARDEIQRGRTIPKTWRGGLAYRRLADLRFDVRRDGLSPARLARLARLPNPI
jgi:hypothetical protein